MYPIGTPATHRPPLPPVPPEPQPPRSPWLPEARPAPAASASASLVIGASDWLGQRLFDQRVVALSGELDDEAVNHAVAQLGLLEATGDAPVAVRLSGVSADLGAALALVDALDLMGAPVHATCLGMLSGPAVAVLAVADRRVAGRHVTVHLCEPRPPHGLPGRELETMAAEHARQLRGLRERIAEACHRPADEVAADMRAGKLLTAQEAQAYGLIDSAGPLS